LYGGVDRDEKASSTRGAWYIGLYLTCGGIICVIK